MNNIAQTSAYTDISRFGALRADARRDSDAALDDVVMEFEALFIQQMLKAAREASVEGGLFNSRELKLYREMMDSQVALAMAEQGGLGFAAALRNDFGLTSDSSSEKQEDLVLPERASVRAQSQSVSTPSWPVPGDLLHAPVASTVMPTEPHVGAEFIRSIRPDAMRAASILGVDADAILAQAALETGWGRHTIKHNDGRSSNNLFAIKAGGSWAGDTVDVETLEYLDGRAVRINATFRAYPDTRSAFEDYANFLRQNSRYGSALAADGDTRKFVSGLQDAGYATDPKYAEKILHIRDQIRAQSMVAAH